MRVHSASLGLFVPGVAFDPQNPVFINMKKRGTGDFVPGWFPVPQNPVSDGQRRRGTGDFVPGCFAVPQNPILDAGLGDTVPTGSMYPIAQNTVLAYYENGGISNEGGLSGLGCGCGGKCGGCGDDHCGGGLGDISSDLTLVGNDLSLAFQNPTNMTAWENVLSDTVLSIPVWGYLAAVAVFAMYSNSSGGRRRR